MTLNGAKAAIPFPLTLVMISNMPVSWNRYFTENCPLGTVMLLNLKLANCPLLLYVTRIFATRFFKQFPVFKF